ncbi:MAG: DUF1801 domain-containing protein [Alphaproteobacteria bacterium]|nr:DUF1801 domain-containing protein [Alphaproteobacteria bacterium]
MNVFAAHIEAFPKPVQQRLNSIDKLIHKLMPKAERAISYGIPTFKQGGKNAVHFAGFKNHVSLFPGAAATAHFAPRLKAYKTSRGTIQFQNDEELPLGLIEEIVRWRLAQMG